MNTQTKMDLSEHAVRDNKFYSYPAHKILSVFDRAENLQDALDELKRSGFQEREIEVITNPEQIDFSGEEHGFWGRFVRSIQHYSSEGKYLDRYEQELNDGHLLLTVVARNAETREKAREILQRRGGHRLTYFGNWVIESIPESRPTVFDTHVYGFRREVKIPFAEALERTRKALQTEGFGVLCEIGIKEKLKEKLGVDFRNYVILGACNPPLAHRALQEDLDIGLLLPCSVVVYEWNSGAVVAAIDAKKMMSVAGNPRLEPTAETVNEKLRQAIGAI
jgi:uncharacterized protein (DUF302 family)